MRRVLLTLEEELYQQLGAEAAEAGMDTTSYILWLLERRNTTRRSSRPGDSSLGPYVEKD